MSILGKAPQVARVLLGSIFLIFGLNGLLGFIPQPPPPAAALPFIGGLAAAGYLLPLLKLSEIFAGALLLSSRFVPLALAVLAPIVVNIVAFHVFLAPAGIGLALLVLLLEIYLAWTYRAAYRPMLAAKAEPKVSARHTPIVARVPAR
jgi:uncharacterized membrane protein YphA (DoxX/SURF4 family)